MKEQQILLGTCAFPMAWILWNSLACTPKGSKDFEIKKNRSRDLYKTLITLNKLNVLIHIARLIDNTDTFADNSRTSVFRRKLKQLKQPCPVLWRHGPRNVTWCLGWIFQSYFSEICLIISLENMDTETISAFRCRLYWLFSCLRFTRRGWLCDFPPK